MRAAKATHDPALKPSVIQIASGMHYAAEISDAPE
jgi:hypothetical protein